MQVTFTPTMTDELDYVVFSCWRVPERKYRIPLWIAVQLCVAPICFTQTSKRAQDEPPG